MTYRYRKRSASDCGNQVEGGPCGRQGGGEGVALLNCLAEGAKDVCYTINGTTLLPAVIKVEYHDAGLNFSHGTVDF